MLGKKHEKIVNLVKIVRVEILADANLFKRINSSQMLLAC